METPNSDRKAENEKPAIKPQPNPETKQPKEKEPKDQEETEDSFDFGGLPKRDLKKNLGCG